MSMSRARLHSIGGLISRAAASAGPRQPMAPPRQAAGATPTVRLIDAAWPPMRSTIGCHTPSMPLAWNAPSHTTTLASPFFASASSRVVGGGAGADGPRAGARPRVVSNASGGASGSAGDASGSSAGVTRKTVPVVGWKMGTARHASASASASAGGSPPSYASADGGERFPADGSSSSSKEDGARGEASSDRVGAGLRGDGTAPRFYKTVDVVELDGGWGITLDGRTLKIPGSREPLCVPTKALALAVAAEWEWQSGRSIRPFTMPLMALVSTAVNQMSLGEVRNLHIRRLLDYLSSDVTLCRAEPGPVAERQKLVHGPILEWARSELGDVQPSESIFGADQAPEVIAAAEKRLRSLDAYEAGMGFRV